jgi:hypothetical protein
MGPSVGFVRGWLSLWALVGVVGLALGGVNELLGLGLFPSGYPVLGGDDGYGGFALQVAIAVVALIGLSILLERFER